MTALPTAEVLLSIREDFFSPQFTACWWKKGARLTMSSEGGKSSDYSKKERERQGR